MDVFISYSRKDCARGEGGGKDVIGRIQDAFKTAGISYWLDEEGIHSGETFASVISRNIAECSVFLFVSSVNSNASRWTCGEIATASSYDKRIIPFKIDDAPYDSSVTIYLAALDAIDYKASPDKALRRLVKSVQAYLEEKEVERQRMEEEQRLLAEQKRLAAERERIRIENEKVIARLSVKEAELEEKISVLDGRIGHLLEDKGKLLERLATLKKRTIVVRGEPVPTPESFPVSETTQQKIDGSQLKTLIGRIAAAAALVLFIVVLFLLRKPTRQNDFSEPAEAVEIAPKDGIAVGEIALKDTFEATIVIETPETVIPEAVPKPEPEEVKPVFKVDGHESDFSLHTGETGGAQTMIVEGGRYSVDPKKGGWWEVLNETRRGFTLGWDDNRGVARKVEIQVKSGKETIRITLEQPESKLYADSLKQAAAAAMAETERQERARQEEALAAARASVLQTKPFTVNGLRVNMRWVEERVVNNAPVGHYESLITKALKKKVLTPARKTDEYNEPATFASQEESLSFIQELNRLTGEQFSITVHGNDEYYIILRP